MNTLQKSLEKFNNNFIIEQTRGNIRFEINFNKIDNIISILNDIKNLKEIPNNWFNANLDELYAQAEKQKQIETDICNNILKIKNLLIQNKILNIDECEKFDKNKLKELMESDELL